MIDKCLLFSVNDMKVAENGIFHPLVLGGGIEVLKAFCVAFQQHLLLFRRHIFDVEVVAKFLQVFAIFATKADKSLGDVEKLFSEIFYLYMHWG